MKFCQRGLSFDCQKRKDKNKTKHNEHQKPTPENKGGLLVLKNFALRLIQRDTSYFYGVAQADSCIRLPINMDILETVGQAIKYGLIGCKAKI